MLLSEFDFTLPKELIAQNPLKDKSLTKLLVFDGKKIVNSYFNNIIDFLQEEDVLVFNDVKVIKAKLLAKIKENNIKVEFNLDQEIFDENYCENKTVWRSICKGSRKIKENDIIVFEENFEAKIIKKFEDGFCLLEFVRENFFKNLEKYGKVPLPPYIKRENFANKEDEKNYQTIYAKNGSGVAAPTAGLHFSEEIFAKLRKKNIQQVFLTLNVGAGTFLPVRTQKIMEHKMHQEYFEISKETCEIINEAKKNNKRIIAVGTTSLRVLESVCDENGFVKSFKGTTDIFIYPGYKFKIIDGLITNFHLPKSTLFMLVCAFLGKENACKIYENAIANSYRFFSYGDSSFLTLR